MKHFLSALVVLTLSAQVLAAPPSEDWELVFADEFDGTEADLDRDWTFHNGPHTHILCSRWRENVSVSDGLCHLHNRKESRGGQDWTSGSFWTKRKFKYGYFEARYRYGTTTGLNNSFWIMPWLPRGAEGRFEIDINEGHYPNELNSNIHQWSGEHWSKSRSMKIDGANLSREFHTYALLWTEDELVWYFEGKEIRREKHDICRGEAPVIFSSAIMNWAGPVTDAVDGTEMTVDYVRVYQRKAETE